MWVKQIQNDEKYFQTDTKLYIYIYTYIFIYYIYIHIYTTSCTKYSIEIL